jgi:DtxR family Mn-dependent transcriptional regulator
MLKQTRSTENYLKAIFRLSGFDYGGLPDGQEAYPVNTNSLAMSMRTKPSSVTSMLVKLSERGLVDYQPYQGALLTAYGHRLATHVVRRHRLWEFFLDHSLGLGKDQIHELAEELEHVRSILLIDKLSDFLGTPPMDPHGNPIPRVDGSMVGVERVPLNTFEPDHAGALVFAGLAHRDLNLLRELNAMGFLFGQTFRVHRKGDQAEKPWILDLLEKDRIQLTREQVEPLLVLCKPARVLNHV